MALAGGLAAQQAWKIVMYCIGVYPEAEEGLVEADWRLVRWWTLVKTWVVVSMCGT